MPHIMLEHSQNIIKKSDFSGLFSRLHELLANQLPTNIASCKSRAISYADFYLGTGAPDSAFVHVTLKVMSGRTPDKLRQVGNEIMKILHDYFSESNASISLEIIELAENSYFKQ